jgi:hypothetical protein
MSLNAFDGVTVTDDGKTVFVDGHSNPPFEADEIDVVIIAVADEDKRLKGKVANPHQSSWTAQIDQSKLSDDEAFAAGEEVTVVGSARAESGEVDLWAGIVKAGERKLLVHVPIAHR